MKIKGTRSFTLSQIERYELLVIQAALNDHYKLEMNGCKDGGITYQGKVALRLLNQINDFRDNCK
jgi:hypothetical protein